jgi:hypothetical protein
MPTNYSATRGTFVIPIDPLIMNGSIPVMYGYGNDLLPQRNAKGVIIMKAARTGVFEKLRTCKKVAYVQGGLTSGVGKFYKLHSQYTLDKGKKFNPTVEGLYLILRWEETGTLEIFRFTQI